MDCFALDNLPVAILYPQLIIPYEPNSPFSKQLNN